MILIIHLHRKTKLKFSVMKKERKNQLSKIMNLAWAFVKRNGFTMGEALKVAWRNFKLKSAMQGKIVKFYFQKVDGTLREAYGTLKESLLPVTQGSDRKTNYDLQTYFDTEKGEWRCFKKANLVKIN